MKGRFCYMTGHFYNILSVSPGKSGGGFHQLNSACYQSGLFIFLATGFFEFK